MFTECSLNVHPAAAVLDNTKKTPSDASRCNLVHEPKLQFDLNSNTTIPVDNTIPEASAGSDQKNAKENVQNSTASNLLKKVSCLTQC
jgi:hypothetical protein